MPEQETTTTIGYVDAGPIVLDPTSHAAQLIQQPGTLPAYNAQPVTHLPPAVTIALDPLQHSDAVAKATWTGAYVNDLPDSSFLYVESGDKDGDGKTTPRSKRHFPYKDASGAVDLPHLRNAIARIPQSNAPGLTPAKKTALQERARKMLDQANKCMAPEPYYPLYGATSFTELDEIEQAQETGYEVQRLTNQFQMMVGNIMADPEVADKSLSITRLTQEFINRIKQPIKPKAGVFKRVLDALTGKSKEEAPAEVEEDFLQKAASEQPFYIWKQKDGSYRWFAIYSNQFRDQDNPPEIISEQSHKGFISLVTQGLAPMPELWHWHVPGTRWGQADVLDYVEGFALAGGFVDPGHEEEAEALSKMGDIRVSHGMPSRFIVRNQEDPTIIEFHVTAEISPLPGWAAANPLTEFVVL